MAMLATSKHTVSIHPATKRKRLRYEHPFSTHCRCIGRTDGSATGSGKSGSSGATSVAGAGRGAKSFMNVCVMASRASGRRWPRTTAVVRAIDVPAKALSDFQRYEGAEGKKLLSKNDRA